MSEPKEDPIAWKKDFLVYPSYYVTQYACRIESIALGFIIAVVLIVFGLALCGIKWYLSGIIMMVAGLFFELALICFGLVGLSKEIRRLMNSDTKRS